MRAESTAERAEARRQVLEEESAGLKLKLKTASARLEELQEQHRAAEGTIERLKRAEKELTERVGKLQTSLNEETSQRMALDNSVRDMESRQKRVAEQLREEHEVANRKHEELSAMLTAEINELKSKLGRAEEQTSAAKSSVKRDEDSSAALTQKGANKKQPRATVTGGAFLSGEC
jgi:chromosome segregation ATPase